MRDFGILIFSCEREVNEDEVTLSDDGAVSAASTSITWRSAEEVDDEEEDDDDEDDDIQTIDDDQP